MLLLRRRKRAKVLRISNASSANGRAAARKPPSKSRIANARYCVNPPIVMVRDQTESRIAMPNEDPDAKIKRMALELADTGPYDSWEEIELVLRFSGHSRARTVLSDPELQRLLNERCAVTSARTKRR